MQFLKGCGVLWIVHLKLILVAENSDVSKLTEHPETPAKPSGETSITEIADI